MGIWFLNTLSSNLKLLSLMMEKSLQVLKCGDLVFEHLVKQLEVVVVDDGEVFGDIDIGNVKCAYVVEGFINITLTELHEIPR